MENKAVNNNEKIIGAIILMGMIGAIIWLGGLEFLSMATAFILCGLFGVYLYSFKTNSWVVFLFLKVPANILFNPFYLILLLKSWTMLAYKDQLDELDRNHKGRKLGQS